MNRIPQASRRALAAGVIALSVGCAARSAEIAAPSSSAPAPQVARGDTARPFATTAEGIPLVYGEPAYPGPIARAPVGTRALWAAASAELEPFPAPPEPLTDANHADWLHTRLTPWLAARAQRMHALALVPGSQGTYGPADQLLEGLARYHAATELVSASRAVPPPPALASQPEVLDAYRAALDTGFEPTQAIARAGARECAASARGLPPPLDGWASRCAAHLRKPIHR